MTTITLTGRDAITLATLATFAGVRLDKHTDPTEGAREGLTIAEAHAVASEDPSLIFAHVMVPSSLTARERDDNWIVEDEGGGTWFPASDAEIGNADIALALCHHAPTTGVWRQ